MSKLDELGGYKYTAGFLVAHSDERVKAAGRDILALIERIEELEQELERERARLAGCSAAALGYGEPVSPGSYGHSASYDDVMGLYAKVQRYRELAEMVDEFLTRYPFSGKLAINIKTMTRELLKEGV